MKGKKFGRQAAHDFMQGSEKWGVRVPGWLSKEDRVKLLAFMRKFMESSEYKNAKDPTQAALLGFEEWQKSNP